MIPFTANSGTNFMTAGGNMVASSGNSNNDLPVTWDVCRVAQWLTEIDLGEYQQIFQENEIDGSLLTGNDFTDEILKDFITKVGHRMKFQRARKELLESNKRAAENSDSSQNVVQNSAASDLPDSIAAKQREIETLKQQVNLHQEQIENYRKQAKMQLNQIEIQNNELTKWKEAVNELENANKLREQIIQTQQQKIQTQEQNLQKQNEQVSLLLTTINDQKKQIEIWFKTVQEMQSLPRASPKVSFNDVSPDTQNMLRNPPASTPTIAIVPPGAPPNAAPHVAAGHPAIIPVTPGIGTSLTPGQPLASTATGPSSNVTFPIVVNANGNLTMAPNIPDMFDINNYGTYQVTIFDETQHTTLVSAQIAVVPDPKICVPQRFVIRDALNNIVAGGTVILKNKNGSIAFTGVSDSTGTVVITNTLPDGIYDVEIKHNTGNLKPLLFQMVIFRNIRPPVSNQFQPVNVTNPNEMKFVLKWGALPRDLDSHMYASDGTHIFYQKKIDGTMSLDCDVTNGNGPETITVNFRPGVKYVYVVHRYSKDGELTASNAQVEIHGTGTQLIGNYAVPRQNQPQANFWIVCVIDGSTKNIKNINRFENHDNYSTNEVGAKYFNA